MTKKGMGMTEKGKGMTEELSFPNVSIGNPLHLVIPDLIGNPESFERPKVEWIPVFTGMTKKGMGMTVELSFPNVSIGNPEEICRIKQI